MSDDEKVLHCRCSGCDETQRLRAGLAVRDEALAEIAALADEWSDGTAYGECTGTNCAGCADGRRAHQVLRILSSLQRSLDPYRDDKEQRAAVPQDKGSNDE